MLDLGVSKLALIAVVALVFVGPEKLPRVARMAGSWLGRAQRYVNEVKAEVNASMALDELREMKASVERAARDVHSGVSDASQHVRGMLEGGVQPDEQGHTTWRTPPDDDADAAPAPAVYQAPRKNWRLRRTAVPQWYKARSGVRTHTLSGAARVARYRPKRQPPASP